MNQIGKFGVGQPVRRREDDRFLRGDGRYVDDIAHEGQLHAAFLRSMHAHAILQTVDAAAAKTAPGVRAVWTATDAAAAGLVDLHNQAPAEVFGGAVLAPATMPPLARDRLRFVGQPIAMVVAETRAQAEEAAELVEIDAVELPAVTSATAALAEDAPELHGEAPGNRALVWEAGDDVAVEAAFAEAAHLVAVSVRSQRLIVTAMEPRACNALYDPDLRRWLFHVASQGAHNIRVMLAAALGVEADRLRVITPDVGGGFGMKLMLHPEYALVAAAARDLGRPVKWTASRSESFLSDAQGRDLTTEAEGAFDAEGRILGLRCRSISNLGAYYSQFGAAIHGPFSAPLLGGVYRAPALHLSLNSAFTNTTPTDAYRGAGRPEINLVTETLIETAAERLGIDPAEMRRRNLLARDEFPHVSPTGVTFDSGDGPATLDLALDAADYAAGAARKAESRARGLIRGIGLAYYMERTGGGPAEEARIRVRADGRVEAWIGTQSSGQGHETAWSQLIVERLGVPFDAIDFPPGDSDLLPLGGGTGGSRSLIMAHRTFFQAADQVIATGRRIAAERLETAEADIEFSPQDALFRVVGTDRTLSLFETAALAADEFGEAAILGAGSVSERTATFPNGAHVAEVELDPATGALRLVAFTVADDFGRVLNPLLVEGQVHGGAAQGIGQALCEGAAFDAESGQPLTGSLMDYALPRAADLPFFFTTRLNESAPTPTNPLGVKGAGEAGSVGATPAVAFAVRDALREAGVAADAIDALEPPYAPAKLWMVLNNNRA